MKLDFEKLAEKFGIGVKGMDEDERQILASAIETVILEKQAGNIEDLSEEQVVLLGAAVADEVLKPKE